MILTFHCVSGEGHFSYTGGSFWQCEWRRGPGSDLMQMFNETVDGFLACSTCVCVCRRRQVTTGPGVRWRVISMSRSLFTTTKHGAPLWPLTPHNNPTLPNDHCDQPHVITAEVLLSLKTNKSHFSLTFAFFYLSAFHFPTQVAFRINFSWCVMVSRFNKVSPPNETIGPIGD